MRHSTAHLGNKTALLPHCLSPTRSRSPRTTTLTKTPRSRTSSRMYVCVMENALPRWENLADASKQASKKVFRCQKVKKSCATEGCGQKSWRGLPHSVKFQRLAVFLSYFFFLPTQLQKDLLKKLGQFEKRAKWTLILGIPRMDLIRNVCHRQQQNGQSLVT